MTYSKINVSKKQDDVPGFSFKLAILILAVIATLGVNVMLFNANNNAETLQVNDTNIPVTTEMVILVK